MEAGSFGGSYVYPHISDFLGLWLRGSCTHSYCITAKGCTAGSAVERHTRQVGGVHCRLPTFSLWIVWSCCAERALAFSRNMCNIFAQISLPRCSEFCIFIAGHSSTLWLCTQPQLLKFQTFRRKADVQPKLYYSYKQSRQADRTEFSAPGTQNNLIT